MRLRFVFLLSLAGCSAAPKINDTKLVDLSYSFNAQTIYWPTARQFELTPVKHGHDASGKWYASNDFCASEHGGTHMDAPIHFSETGWATEQIPLNRLIAPARVIDIRPNCRVDRNYCLQPEDILDYESHHGRIAPGDAVLIHTGFDQFYPDAQKYLGSAQRGVAANLSFPGIGEAAAKLLVERRVDLVGLDTASLDNGPSTDFIAHRILNGANIPGLENLANLDKLPPVGATLIALPMKIEAGTGGPCRVVAVLP